MTYHERLSRLETAFNARGGLYAIIQRTAQDVEA